ncbi:tetratricopeptide repeat protein [Streptomyces sp. NPDC006925]|uniref:tetratricopeptide repeat protein n=1 Tax=Streptomyces sp. NPDC006925 TaxID=3364768 RepID=UPI0036AAECDF
MASPPSTSPAPQHRPNTAFRALRGHLSPGEFAAAVRRAAREIGEQVSCDARYIGRVESGEIRCPNYAYERVFLHMFPGCSLTDMGFAPREAVRGRAARTRRAHMNERAPLQPTTRRNDSTHSPHPPFTIRSDSPGFTAFLNCPEYDEESDVLRRAFMTGGPAALATTSLGGTAPSARAAHPAPPAAPAHAHVGDAEAGAVEDAVRRIRLLDDRHGGTRLYRRAIGSLQAAYGMLDAGTHRQSITDRLHAGAGELAISVGWLAHDSGRYSDARSHYGEALATARVAQDPALEAHAFCNTAFLARDAGRPREAVRAAQAGRQAAESLGSHHLLSLLALREAGGWSGLGDRAGCQQALARARRLFAKGTCESDPEWMTFFGEAELEGLEAQCWSALGMWDRAAEHAARAVQLQDPHFTRNRALFTAELAGDLAALGQAEEAAAAGSQVLDFLGRVQSTRISAMLEAAAERLTAFRGEPAVAAFLDRRAATA